MAQTILDVAYHHSHDKQLCRPDICIVIQQHLKTAAPVHLAEEIAKHGKKRRHDRLLLAMHNRKQQNIQQKEIQSLKISAAGRTVDSFLVVREDLLPVFLLIRLSVQYQPAPFSHRGVDQRYSHAHMLLNQLCQLHLADFLHGGYLVAGLLWTLLNHDLVGQLHRIVQIQHGKNISLTCRNFTGS